MGRKVAFALSLVVLLVTGVLGVYNGSTEWGEGETPLQHSVTVGVFVYGVFGLLTAYGLIRRRRWSLKTAIVWAICVSYVPGFAVMAYADKDATPGSAIAASAGGALIALGVIWTISRMTRANPVGVA
ncbi:MAG TPA: hypothetical protein VF105_11580 [Gemmatimonadaceae bacterium]